MPLPISSDRSGWPWDIIPSALPETMSNGMPWPRVSIITPSFNQASFLEETIRSVLLQGYPAIEYLIYDGGSTDDSASIIQKYAAQLAYWESTPDRGQSHAINKGLRRATGAVIAWLNSDDTYLPGAIVTAVTILANNPQAGFVYGSAHFVNEHGGQVGYYGARPLGEGIERLKYWQGWPVPQPAMFFRRELLDRYGFLDESFHYGLDYEWIVRVTQSESSLCIKDVLATYRIHSQSKTSSWQAARHLFFAETRKANLKYAPLTQPASWSLWVADFAYRFKEYIRRLRMARAGG